MSTTPAVFVVVPVFMREADTRRCVSQLLSQTYPNIQIIVADGGSKDGSRERIKEEFPTLLWVTPKSGEWWWSGSVAFGIKAALEISKDTRDYILMMNNDTVFPTDFVEVLVRTSQEQDRAAVGALTVDLNTGAVLDAGVRLQWDPYYHFPVNTRVPPGQKWSADVNVLPGRGSLVPIDAFNKLGNIRWRLLPHYIADYEFFFRLSKAGIPMIVSFETTLKSDTNVTGLFYNGESALSLRQWWKLTTSRRSMSNIIDHTIFVLLTVPKDFRWQSVGQVLWGNFSNLFSKTVPGKALRKLYRVVRFGPRWALGRFARWLLDSSALRPVRAVIGSFLRAVIPGLSFTYAEIEAREVPVKDLKAHNMGVFSEERKRFQLSLRHYIYYRLGRMDPLDSRAVFIKKLLRSRDSLIEENFR